MSLPDKHQFRVRDQRKPNHHWADNEVLDDCAPRIGAYGYAVYMYICRWAGNDDGRCTKSQREIANAFGISTDTVGRAVQKLIDAGLIAKQDEPGRPSEFIVLEVRKRFQKPTAHSGIHLPPTAAHLPPTAAHLPPTAARPPLTAARNKEIKLSQDFSQDLKGNRPAWMIAQKQFWDEFERQAPRAASHIANPDAEQFQRFRAAANRVGLSATQAKNILLEHPAWKDWPYTTVLDSRQEIIFPEPEKTELEKPRPVVGQTLVAQTLGGQTLFAEAPSESEARARVVWQHVHDFVKARISANSYSTWVKPLRAVALTNGTLIVRIPTPEFKHVGRKFGEIISQAIFSQAIAGQVIADPRNTDPRNIGPLNQGRVMEVKFVTQEEIAAHPPARSA